MINYLILPLFFMACLSAAAQPGQFTKAEESDPEAKAILEKIRKKYEAYRSLEAAFTLQIEIPEQPTEVQKGIIAQQGDKYRFQLGSQTVISDGTAIWLILDNNKEVQINDVPDEEEDDNLLSPQSMLRFYDKGNFVYVLINEFMEGGQAVQQIEFKPLDEKVDFAKLRMTINKGNSDLVWIKAFAKDGSRYTLTIDGLTPNKAFAEEHFRFDPAKYPGYYVEDLRE